MNFKITLFALAAFGLAACGDNGAAGVSATKGDISQNRSSAFKSFMPTFSSMGKVAKGDDAYDVEKFKALAASFQDEAKEPFNYFQNDPQGNGDALPVIWAKPAEFKAEQEKFQAAVAQLNAAAKTGNLENIRVAYQTVENRCSACHQTYRQPK
ncbi:c-type cytochrome [Kingella negevensis]|uniref:c-type cytochrome n=1 Tax=Kingella negevensis TaxID=1522312 RepID=UPI000A272508|nr:cytochrome c [Kingella negevensis]WII91854.1 cytochrome c [Kingella negevensis]